MVDVTEWRRADHRDPPAVGDEIEVVMYPADTRASVVHYPRMRVEIVIDEGRSVLGPTLPAPDRIIKFPGRPDDIVGRRAFFWRLYDGDA